jgi:rhomboid family protein
MLFLFFFGRALERQIGPDRLLICFFVGGIISLLASVIFYNHDQAVVGASGAICTVIGLLMIYSPWRISFLLNFFPMPMGVAALTYLLLNFFLAYSPAQGGNGLHTAYHLHIVGFFAGIGFGILWNPDWKKNLLISILSFIGFYLIIGLIFYYFSQN